MNKTLRYSVLSLLLMLVTGINAQSVFNFDNDYATLFPTLPGTSSNDSHDGDFTEATTSVAVDGITVTVSAKDPNSSNENRVWYSSPRLRMYSGTLTVTAPEGKNITAITFTGHSSNFNLTTETGTLDGKEWAGSANEIVFNVLKNTQISTMTIALDGQVVEGIENTPETAYTVAKANELIAAGVGLNDAVYVKGKVSGITEISVDYGNATYYISDDGSDENRLLVFRGYSLEGNKFTAEDEIKLGDEVIVYGKLVNYNGTYEVATGSSIYSLNGETSNISGVKADSDINNGVIYNMAGQRIQKPVKGINIIGGKKIMKQ